MVLEKLRVAGLKLQPTKCQFSKKKITYLGNVVSKERVQINSQKIKVIVEWPTPTNVTKVRSFLGFANYYRSLSTTSFWVTMPKARGRQYKD